MGKKAKLETEYRRKRLMKLIAAGIASPTQLAEILEVTRRTIYNDLKALKEEILKNFQISPQKLFIDIYIKYEARNSELWRIVTSTENEAIKLGALNSIIKNDEAKIKLFQSLGFLKQEPEKIQIINNELKEAIERKKRELQNDASD